MWQGDHVNSKYLITVSALGYETLEFAVDAETLALAKKSERLALAKWVTLNDIEKSNTGLAWVKYSKL